MPHHSAQAQVARRPSAHLPSSNMPPKTAKLLYLSLRSSRSASMGDLERYDPALLGVAQQISAAALPGENPIDTLLDLYFGFLRRKTDFFRRAARQQRRRGAKKRMGTDAPMCALARAPDAPHYSGGAESSRAREAVLAALERQTALANKEAAGTRGMPSAAAACLA